MQLSRIAARDYWAALEHRHGVAGRRAADRLEQQFRHALALIGRNPLLGAVRPTTAQPPLRFWLVPPYWIVYDPDQRIVLRIVDARRDVARVLAEGQR